MMKARAGRIINISSVVAQSGNAGQANYVAAKAGLIGLTKAIAIEIASRGITVNAVAPGFIETPMTDVLSDKVKEELKVRIPLGRMGSARDVAAAIVFLASDEAGYITGHVLKCEWRDAFGMKSVYAMAASFVLLVLFPASPSTETVASKVERYQVWITSGLKWEADPGEKGQTFALARVLYFGGDGKFGFFSGVASEKREKNGT